MISPCSTTLTSFSLKRTDAKGDESAAVFIIPSLVATLICSGMGFNSLFGSNVGVGFSSEINEGEGLIPVVVGLSQYKADFPGVFLSWLQNL